MLAVVERHLATWATPGASADLARDLDYLVSCIEPYNVESITLEGNEQLAGNLARLQRIFTVVVDRLYDAVNLLEQGTEAEIRKYADIVACLSKEVTELLGEEEAVKSNPHAMQR